jgi:serine phosphatase RsbU (regulator of sigma subunit)
MLLYTDGVTDAGPRSAPVEQAGLEECLRRLAGEGPEPIVDAVERFVVDAQDGDPKDDIALLAIRVQEPGA